MPKKFNYFNDFNAAERVGTFIKVFINEMQKTNNQRQALNSAITKYISLNKIDNRVNLC